MADCPKCGVENAPDKKFCTQCGASLPEPGADAAPQRSGIPAPPPVNPFRQAQPPETALKPRSPRPQPAQPDPEPQTRDTGDSAQPQAPEPPAPAAAPAPLDKTALPPMFQPPEREQKSTAPMSPSFTIAPDPDAEQEGDEDWGADPGAAGARSDPQDLFQRKPWLARALGFGCVFFFVIPVVIALTVKAFRNPAPAPVRAASPAAAALTPADAPGKDCAMFAKISSGEVSVQPRPGMHFIPLPQGGCAAPGAAIMTGAHGRLQLEIRDPAATLFVNSQSSVFLNPAAEGATRAPSLLRMQQGEIWLSFSGAEDPLVLALPAAVITATGAGEFHFMARGEQSFVTSATGALLALASAATAPLVIGRGQQAVFGGMGQVTEFKDIERDRFLRWVNTWKQNMGQPAPRADTASATGTGASTGGATDTAASPDPAEERQRIVDTVLTSPPAPIPDFVQAEVVTVAGDWAIAKTTDSRPDGAYNEDYWPQTAVLLKKEPSGHWRALEFFADYTPDLLMQWGQRHGFNKKYAKSLGLE